MCKVGSRYPGDLEMLEITLSNAPPIFKKTARVEALLRKTEK